MRAYSFYNCLRIWYYTGLLGLRVDRTNEVSLESLLPSQF